MIKPCLFIGRPPKPNPKEARSRFNLKSQRSQDKGSEIDFLPHDLVRLEVAPEQPNKAYHNTRARSAGRLPTRVRF